MLNQFMKSCLVVSALGSGSAWAQQTTAWSNATANGNGCPPGSSTVTVTPGGDEIAWTFSEFGFDLVQPASASRFCRLSASAHLAGGYYLAQLKQEITYGGIKSTWGSRIMVGARSRFFGFNLPPLIRDYPSGTPLNSIFESAVSTNNFTVFAPPSYFCRGGVLSGLFQSTVSANGQVFPGGGSASLAVQGQNVTFRAIAGWVACPPS